MTKALDLVAPESARIVGVLRWPHEDHVGLLVQLPRGVAAEVLREIAALSSVSFSRATLRGRLVEHLRSRGLRYTSTEATIDHQGQRWMRIRVQVARRPTNERAGVVRRTRHMPPVRHRPI